LERFTKKAQKDFRPLKSPFLVVAHWDEKMNLGKRFDETAVWAHEKSGLVTRDFAATPS